MPDQTSCDSLLTLIYVSSSVDLLAEEEILDILRVSQRNNARVGVTGVLLYESGNFMQVLEGPQKAVRDTVARIKRDPRHSGYLQLLAKECTERHFGQWSMGFKKMAELDEEDRRFFTSYLEDDAEWLKEQVPDPSSEMRKSSAAHVLLKSFKRSYGIRSADLPGQTSQR